ncbi:MAG: hypothetical protein AAGA35_00090 [Patescibacteria group bacterium]
MFRAIGLLISLFAISLYFESSLRAFDAAATESFRAVEAAAVLSQQQIKDFELSPK